MSPLGQKARGPQATPLFGTALLLVALTSCITSFDQFLPDEPAVFSGAVFDYTAWGAAEAPILEGTLTITTVDSAGFSGSWEIHRTPGSDTTLVVGPQTGSGTLRGVVANGEIGVDLVRGDPTVSVRLFAAPDQSGWHGRWFFRVESVFRAGGAFRASVRRE